MNTMKRTKNLLMLMALVLSIGLISCDEQKLNEEVTPQELNSQRSRLANANTRAFDASKIDDWQGVDKADLPPTIQDYLDENYSGVGIYELWLTDTGEYILLLENDMVLIFNGGGEFILAFDLADILGDEDFEGEEWEDWDEVNPADLPQSIRDYLATNYPDATIEEAYVDPETGEYIVILDTGICVIFDKDGNFLEEIDEDEFGEEWDEVDPADLPQAIKDYVTSNYANETIEEAGVDAETGDFIVVLESGIILVFDADSNFIEAYDDEEYGDEDWDEVDITTLPQIILDYIATNYTDASIEEAAVNTETGDYVVFLNDGTVVEFDKDGQFVEAYDEEDEYGDCTEVEVTDLPEAILTYISSNYADRTIDEAYFNEDEQIYYVILDNDTVVVFDKDGNFLEEETDG